MRPSVHAAHDQTLRSRTPPGPGRLDGVVAILGPQHAARHTTRNVAYDNVYVDEGVLARRCEGPEVTAGLPRGRRVEARVRGVWHEQLARRKAWAGSPDLARAGAAGEDSTERRPRPRALHQVLGVIHARPGRCAPVAGVVALQHAPRLATANDPLEHLDPDADRARPLAVVAAGVGATGNRNTAASRGVLCEVRRDHLGLGGRGLIVVVAGD